MKVRREYLSAMLAFADVGGGRPVLGGIYISSTECAAADSYTLAIAPISEPGSLEGKVLDVTAIRLALKVISKSSTHVRFRGHADHAYIVCEFGMFKVPYIKGNFPDYTKLVRRTVVKDGSSKVALGPGFLSRVATAMKPLGPITRISLGKTERDPVEFNCRIDNELPMTFVVMPMFVDWTADEEAAS